MTRTYISDENNPVANKANRFWSKVDKSGGCWIWTAAKDRKGYGKFSIGPGKTKDGTRRNGMVSAHRYSYEMANGPIPKHPSFHGFCVLHHCDNPSCVNPDHLFLGTNEDNVHDMDNKGRRVNKQKKGSAHPNAILNEAKVKEIVASRRDGMSCVTVAMRYGISPVTVSAIMKGRIWQHMGLLK